MQWALPGGGLGAAVAWVANRKVRRAHDAKEIQDTYKVMYERVSALLIENQKKNEQVQRRLEENQARMVENQGKMAQESCRLKRALDRLSRAIEAIPMCPHNAMCPVSRELQDAGGDPMDDGGKRKRRGKRAAERDDGGDSDMEGGGEGRHGAPACEP